MSSLARPRALAARAALVVLPFAVAGLAAGFGGCSDLVADSPDSGFGGAGDDGAGGDQIFDASPIFLDDASDGASSADGGAEASGDDAGADAGDGAPAPVSCADELEAGFGPYNDLQCTGLYANFATKTLAPGVQLFDPGIHLWSDGASKLRWIYLPPGQKIDTSNMNEWSFPIGTKVWKEFQISGHRIETRYFWKRGTNDWVRGTYVWSTDETSAVYTSQGVTNVNGTTYTVPTIDQCDTCHAGRIEHLLGFEAVSLSQPSSSGLNMAQLVAQGLLTNNPTSTLAIPDDGTGKGAKAIGWLHANCGTACHNNGPSSFAGATGLWMRLEVQPDGTLGDFFHTNTYRTAVNVQPLLAPYASEGWKRILPNDTFLPNDAGTETAEGLSLIPFRDGKRNESGLQMPPIGSNIPDLADVAMVRDWITNGNFPAGTFPP
jgi:hypothetical protein